MTPLFRHKRHQVPTQRRRIERSRSPEEAARSIEREKVKLEDIKAQTPAIAALGKSLKELHERNHIAENLIHIIGGRP